MLHSVKTSGGTQTVPMSSCSWEKWQVVRRRGAVFNERMSFMNISRFFSCRPRTKQIWTVDWYNWTEQFCTSELDDLFNISVTLASGWKRTRFYSSPLCAGSSFISMPLFSSPRPGSQMLQQYSNWGRTKLTFRFIFRKPRVRFALAVTLLM